MSRFLLYISAVFLLATSFAGCQDSKKLNQRLTLWRKDKIPYGTYYARENIHRIFPDAAVYNNKLSPDPNTKGSLNNLIEYGDHTRTCYLIIADKVIPDQQEIEGLFNLVQKGAHIFISGFSIDSDLLDSLQVKAYLYSGLFNDHDSLTVKIYDPVSWKETSYTYPGKALDNHFSIIDSSITTVLGKDEFGKANYIKIAYESGGAFYIHLAPMALSNFFLLHKQNKTYYDQVMSWLPSNAEVVRWDDYFRNSTKGDNKDGNNFKSPYDALNWLSKQPGLWTAVWLLLLLLLIVYLFESKRKQRIIPVIVPLKNASVDFVKTIGRMYFQRKDNKDLAHKMTVHFLAHVRNRYNLRMAVTDEDFVKKLAFKSGYDQQAIQALVYDLRYAQDVHQVSDLELLELNHKLENFYKNA